MKVLSLSNEYGVHQAGSAYGHRLERLRCVLQRRGIQTKSLSLREQPVPRPILAHPPNPPLILKKTPDSNFMNVVRGLAFTRATAKGAVRKLEEV